MSKCKTCDTELDDFARVIPCPCGRFFCKNCGCQVDQFQLDFLKCEDCGIVHPNMSCYQAEKEFGKPCHL